MDPPVKLQLLKGGTGIIPSCLVVLVQLLKSAFKGMAKIVLLPQLSYKQPLRITCTFIAVEIMYCLHYIFCQYYQLFPIFILHTLWAASSVFSNDTKNGVDSILCWHENLFVWSFLPKGRIVCTLYFNNSKSCLHYIFCQHYELFALYFLLVFIMVCFWY